MNIEIYEINVNNNNNNKVKVKVIFISMSDENNDQIVILKQKLNEVWLEESNCSHFNSEKKAEL